MYPSISGSYEEPKVGGEIVHLVCPECDSYLDSMAVQPAHARDVPSKQLGLNERSAA
jgi:hypothetical protein